MKDKDYIVTRKSKNEKESIDYLTGEHNGIWLWTKDKDICLRFNQDNAKDILTKLPPTKGYLKPEHKKEEQ